MIPPFYWDQARDIRTLSPYKLMLKPDTRCDFEDYEAIIIHQSIQYFTNDFELVSILISVIMSLEVRRAGWEAIRRRAGMESKLYWQV